MFLTQAHILSASWLSYRFVLKTIIVKLKNRPDVNVNLILDRFKWNLVKFTNFFYNSLLWTNYPKELEIALM